MQALLWDSLFSFMPPPKKPPAILTYPVHLLPQKIPGFRLQDICRWQPFFDLQERTPDETKNRHKQRILKGSFLIIIKIFFWKTRHLAGTSIFWQ